MTTDIPPVRQHGGRRPGAGAPRGNINALKHAGHSQRYAHAHAFLFMLDQLMPATAPSDSRQRRLLRHRDLDAARWVVRVPMVFNYVREQVLAYLWSPDCKLRRARLMEFWLTKPRTSVTWTELAGMVLYIRKRNLTFGDAFAQYLENWFVVALEETGGIFTQTPRKQSNNQDSESEGGKNGGR